MARAASKASVSFLTEMNNVASERYAQAVHALLACPLNGRSSGADTEMDTTTATTATKAASTVGVGTGAVERDEDDDAVAADTALLSLHLPAGKYTTPTVP